MEGCRIRVVGARRRQSELGPNSATAGARPSPRLKLWPLIFQQRSTSAPALFISHNPYSQAQKIFHASALLRKCFSRLHKSRRAFSPPPPPAHLLKSSKQTPRGTNHTKWWTGSPSAFPSPTLVYLLALSLSSAISTVKTKPQELPRFPHGFRLTFNVTSTSPYYISSPKLGLRKFPTVF